MRMRKDTDLGVGKDQAADQIVLQITLDRNPERFLDQTAPRFARDFISVKSARHFLLRGERPQHRVPNLLGKHARQIIKLFQPLELRVASREFDHRLSAHLFVEIAQKQTAMMSVIHVWRERRSRASAQFKI